MGLPSPSSRGGRRRLNFLKNEKPLWGSAYVNQTVSGSPDAVSGQSGEDTPSPGEDDAQGPRYSLADAIKTTPLHDTLRDSYANDVRSIRAPRA